MSCGWRTVAPVIRRLLILEACVSPAVSALGESLFLPPKKLGGQNKEEVATNPFTYFAKRVTHAPVRPSDPDMRTISVVI